MYLYEKKYFQHVTYRIKFNETVKGLVFNTVPTGDKCNMTYRKERGLQKS